MWTVRQISNNWDDSLWWQQVALPYLARHVHQKLPSDGIRILDKEWDNLVVLDACRFDVFEKLNTVSGTLSKRVSASSNTPEFLRRNFSGKEIHNTVYVTANPQVDLHLTDEFHYIVPVWKDHWDETLHTVPPDIMSEKAVEAHGDFPDKRIIAHYIQPHYPFIGDLGRNELEDHAGMELSKRLASGAEGRRDEKSIWELLYEGDVSRDLVRRAYEENLELVFPHVERLVDQFVGRTVITSDHGNAIGERAWPVPARIYGHPPDIRIPALVDIPWLVVETDERKAVVTEPPTAANRNDREVVEERLADLGYT
jgi:hypothetical protein